MADWPSGDGPQRFLHVPNTNPVAGGGAGSSFASYTMFPPNLSGGKSDWVPIYNPSPFNAAGLLLRIMRCGAHNASAFLDIGIAANGATANTEVVLVPNLCLYLGNSHPVIEIFLPIHIPRNHRISIRSATTSSTGTVSFYMATNLFAENLNFRARNTRACAVGANTSSCLGSSGNIAYTSAAWGGYGAAIGPTPFPIRDIILCISNTTGNAPLAGAVRISFDVAYGPTTSAAAAVGLIRGFELYALGSCWDKYFYGPYPVNIPQGSYFFVGGTTANNFSGDPRFSFVGFG